MARPKRSEPVINLGIRETIYGAFRKYCDDRGLVARVTVEKILGWFVDQPPEVRRAVLGDIDKSMQESYAVVLRKLADDVEGGGTILRASIIDESGRVTHVKRRGT